MRLSISGFTTLLLLALAACAAPSNSRAHVNINGGLRGFSNSDIDKVDKQAVYGIDGAVYLGEGGLGVEGGWLHSDDDDTDTTGLNPIGLEVDEYFGGLRYTLLKDELIEPYVAAGATWLDVKATGGGASADDDGVAAYARVGAAVNLGAVRVGLDGRGVFFSDINFPAGQSEDVDYLQIMAFAGLRF